MKKHIPNIITCCNLLCGAIAVMLAAEGLFHCALGMIILGAVFDFFDGMSARALKVINPIGKEIDSLADVITFGLAPSVMQCKQSVLLPRTATTLGAGGRLWHW